MAQFVLCLVDSCCQACQAQLDSSVIGLKLSWYHRLSHNVITQHKHARFPLPVAPSVASSSSLCAVNMHKQHLLLADWHRAVWSEPQFLPFVSCLHIFLSIHRLDSCIYSERVMRFKGCGYPGGQQWPPIILDYSFLLIHIITQYCIWSNNQIVELSHITHFNFHLVVIDCRSELKEINSSTFFQRDK